MNRGPWFVVREPIRDGGSFDPQRWDKLIARYRWDKLIAADDGGSFDPRDVVRSIRAPSSSVDSS